MMNKFMNEYLKNINSEQENFNEIKSRITKNKKKRLKVLNIAAVLMVVVLSAILSPRIYAKVQQNIKYGEYKRRDYVSGKGEIASEYNENIEMDYLYQNEIGVKIDSMILTDDTFKAVINLKLPDEMRIDKLPENNNDDTNIMYNYGYVIYDEKNNILGCMFRYDEKTFDKSGGFIDYLRCLYKDLGIKFYVNNNYMGLMKSGGIELLELNGNNVITELKLTSIEGFPNSEKIYIRIFNIGHYLSKSTEEENEISKHNDLEWIFEIDAPDKFIKRETIKLTLLDEILKLKINLFTVSETGMLLKGQKKEIIDMIWFGKDMDNWTEVQEALINITDKDGNIYYPVQGGTTHDKNGFYSKFEIDKDLFEETTLYLNMKIGEYEYNSEIIEDYN